MYKNSNLYPFVLSNDFVIATPFATKTPIEGVRGTASQNENETGYRVGDVSCTTTRWFTPGKQLVDGQHIPGINTSVQKTAFTISVDRNNKDAKMCILAIPHRWEWMSNNDDISEDELLKKLNVEEIEEAFKQEESYIYILFIRNPNYTDRYLYVSGQIEDGKYNVLTNAIRNNYNPSTGKVLGAEVVSDRNAAINLAVQRQSVTYSTMTQSVVTNFFTEKMKKWNDKIAERLKYYGLDDYVDYIPFTDYVMSTIDNWLVDKEPLTQTAYLSMERVLPYGISGAATIAAACTPFNAINNAASCTDHVIASSIDTNLPIFTVSPKSLDNMYNYLMGLDYVPDNADDLLISDINLQTDWTIYVKGRQKPDIWVTVNSKGLETYLDSPKNTLNLSKSDISIQYRVPFWSSLDLSVWVKGNTNIPFLPNLLYDKTLSTSFDALTSIGYQSLAWNNFGGTEELFTEWIQTGKTSPQELPYAQLQFRLFLNDKIFSSWCEFGIGFIGSPSVPDFKYMQNWGICLNPTDGSTVTIVYDEYPEGEEPDGYHPPSIDSDKDITNPDPSTGNGTLPDDNTNEGLNLLTQSYRLTQDNLNKLGDFLWKGGFFSNIKLLNNSPIENIVSLKIMPCSVSATTSEIWIGNVDTDINADRVTNVPVMDIGSLKYEGYYKNFLDYSPYTQAFIFLPFIGFYELDPAQCIGNTLSVKYSFDIIMGQCKAMLFVNNIYMTSYEGSCGIDVPLVGSNRAQLEGAFLASAVTAATSGDIKSGIGGMVTNAITAQFHSTRSGSYSSTLGWAETRRCFVVFMIPNAQYPKSFGHDYGYPCNLTYNLGQLSGFTQTIPDPDISGIPCIDEEGAMIKSMLSSGVYL